MRILSPILRSAAALLLLAAAPVFAQNYTTDVTLTKLLAAGGPIPYAQVCVYPADIYGNPISVSAPTWGLLLAGTPAGCEAVVSGAFATPLPVPDAYHTDASGPIYYNISIQQTNSSGTPTAQAVLFKAVANVTGIAWALDAYAPSANVPVPPSNVMTVASAVPGSCTAPSIYLPSSSSTQPAYCQNGVYVSFPSGGSGSAASFTAYSGSTPYTAGNVVLYNNIGYIATATTLGNVPTNTTYWTPLWAAASEPIGAAAQTAVTALATPIGIENALGFTPQATGSITSVGLNALWDFTAMASNTVADGSGNGNAILCGSAGTSGFATPTLTAQGLLFGQTGAGAAANSGCDVPAAINGDRTFVFLTQPYPLPATTYNNSTGNYASAAAQILLGSSATGGMEFEMQGLNQSYFISPAMQSTSNSTYTFTSDRAVGWHVIAFVCGSNASTDPDIFYIDGVQAANTLNVGSCAGVQATAGGHLQLAGLLSVGNKMAGTIALGAAAAAELTQAQIQQVTLYFQGLAPSKGIVLNPLPYRGPNPSVVALGDSIQACYLVSPSTACAILNLSPKVTLTPVNQGIGGITGASVVANLPIRLALIGIPQSGQNIAIWEPGTNDMAAAIGTCTTNPTVTANGIWQNAVAGAALAHSYGYKIVVDTVFTGTGLSPCTQSGLTTFTATTASGSATLSSVSSFAGLQEGQLIAGTGIPAFSEIVGINTGTSTITINQAATATASGVTMTPSGYSKDQVRAIYNTLVRTQWSRYFDAIADTASDPRVPDGAYNNTSVFADAPGGTHPTAAFQAYREASYDQAIDRALLGSSNAACDPNTIVNALSPYADQDVDGCKVIDTAAGNVVVNLMSALYQTGNTKRYCRTDSATSSNTLTINAPSDYPFNNITGSTSITVANGKCQDVQSALVSSQLGGDYWRTLN